MFDLQRMIRMLRRLDWVFILSVILLILVGIVFIYSATYRSAENPMTELTRKQLVWVMVGTGCFLLAALTNYDFVAGQAFWLYSACLVLLVLVLFFGIRIYGAYRWLNLFGFQIQPSEFAKLGTLVALAHYLGTPSRDLRHPATVGACLLITAIPFVLILQQPDLGTAMMLAPLVFIMMYVAGVPMVYLLVLGGLALLSAPLGWFVLDDYQKERIMVFFDPGRDPLGAGWNKIQSEIAVGSGGWDGKGYMMGTQNILGFLPRTVAPTDFIFSVIAEESGFVGSAVVLGLYVVMIGCGMRAAVRARDRLGRLLAAGMTGLLFCHMFVNVAMTVGLMPITGLPLPLISYGGSFMICTMTGLGLIQSVYIRRQPR